MKMYASITFLSHAYLPSPHARARECNLYFTPIILRQEVSCMHAHIDTVMRTTLKLLIATSLFLQNFSRINNVFLCKCPIKSEF